MFYGKLNVKGHEEGGTKAVEMGVHTCKNELEMKMRDCSEELQGMLEPETASIQRYFQVVFGRSCPNGSQTNIPVKRLNRWNEQRQPFCELRGTINITPDLFKQTLIVMAHDPTYNVYLPVVYLLLEAKDELSYWHGLHWIHEPGQKQMSPCSVTCDFEAALIKGIRDQFPETPLISCLFHWKQAIHRNQVDLRIPVNQIAETMAAGVIDVLTGIPIDDIKEYSVCQIVDLQQGNCDSVGQVLVILYSNMDGLVSTGAVECT
ncbi:hypothetical protein PHMEG_0009072 [Phytophthora megakarya]|uniref:MULE transposase domain-containing protein n=1 Tax=Phytophthora megakarya TaxID=4795 RepID=A0A225WIG4_9STRA|nr:hypothetical protein PHMEG_0009072 [Phytophthora megakarya]